MLLGCPGLSRAILPMKPMFVFNNVQLCLSETIVKPVLVLETLSKTNVKPVLFRWTLCKTNVKPLFLLDPQQNLCKPMLFHWTYAKPL